MKALFLTVPFLWLLLGVLHALSIPVENASVNQEKPEGSTKTCNGHEYKPEGKNYCCNKCHAGYRVETHCPEHGQTKCVSCEEDSFMDNPNYSPVCMPCNVCLQQNGQIELSPCTAYKDVQCGCPAGQYKSGKHPGDPNFVCEQCSTCQNRTIIRQCSDEHDTVCQCTRDEFYDESTRRCRSCTECDDADCRSHCPDPYPDQDGSQKPQVVEVHWIVASVAVTLAFLAVAGCAVQYFRSRGQSPSFPDIMGSIKHAAPSMDNTKPENRTLLPGMTAQETDSHYIAATCQEQVQQANLPMPDITERTPRHHSTKALYAIIESVPVRQWREFVRRLGLSEHLIDTSEQDYRHYKDSQYKMLQAWAHLEGSSMEQLYRVLREMSLGGCVERIEERL